MGKDDSVLINSDELLRPRYESYVQTFTHDSESEKDPKLKKCFLLMADVLRYMDGDKSMDEAAFKEKTAEINRLMSG